SSFNSSQSLVYQTLHPFLAFLSLSTSLAQELFPMSRAEEPGKLRKKADMDENWLRLTPNHQKEMDIAQHYAWS
ncbi:MAG: hypothetical protein ACFCVD_05000, partial [Nodosilinea sp.]